MKRRASPWTTATPNFAPLSVCTLPELGPASVHFEWISVFAAVFACVCVLCRPVRVERSVASGNLRDAGNTAAGTNCRAVEGREVGFVAL